STVEPDSGVAMSDPAYSASVAVDADGAAKVVVSGLAERTRYWWRVEDDGVEDTTRTGTFLTPPPAGTPASFVFAASGDAGLGGVGGYTGTVLPPHRHSNHLIHSLICDRICSAYMSEINYT